MTLKRLALLLYLPFAVLPTLAQQPVATTPVTKDPQAVQLATASLAALSGSIQISDITLTGTATRTAGSDVESGNFTLKALGQYQSRLDLAVSGGTRTEVFNLSDTTPQGFWSGTDGVVHQMANHNCLAGEAWFFPPLSVLSQASNTNFVALYVGAEIKGGISVQHIRFVPQDPSASVTDNGLLARLSATDVYLDSSSYLPVALGFSVHPDNNLLISIPVEVDYSNYQIFEGVRIPFHIQKFLNGSLFLDLTIQNVVLNSGLATSAFSAN